MKYKKTAYSNSSVCSSDLSFDQYYNNNAKSDSFYINSEDYTCEECDSRNSALINVRTKCSKTRRSSCTGNNICSSDNTDYSMCTKCSGSCCSDHCINYNSKEFFQAKWKKIQKTVGVSSSEYAMNKASLMVFKNKIEASDTVVNSQSDKLQTAISQNTPRHPSSLMRTKFSLRPGAMNPGGEGVDIKHNSYARYLAKKKGKRALRAEQQTDNTTVKKHNIVMGYYINNGNCCYDQS